jgi:hypothetical protein
VGEHPQNPPQFLDPCQSTLAMVTMLSMAGRSSKDRLEKGERFWQVAIDEQLHRQFKAKCAAEGKTMSDKVQELIRAWLK